MSALVVAAEKLARSTKAAVVLVSHVSQEAGRRAIGDAYAPRGGTALGANGRFTITLARLVDEAAQEFLPGVTLTPQQQRELSILRVPKINSAPKEDPTIVQIVPTHWGLVLRAYDAGTVQAPEERERNARQAVGEHLRALAERMASVGQELTESKLSGGLYKDVPGLAKGRVAAAVTAALEDGHLRQRPRTGRGGGTALLPGEPQETSFGRVA
jgi:hypothetical protein